MNKRVKVLISLAAGIICLLLGGWGFGLIGMATVLSAFTIGPVAGFFNRYIFGRLFPENQLT